MRKKSPLFSEKIKDLDLKRTVFQPREALDLAQKLSYENFDASLEVHVRTGIDPKKGDQIIRASATLPHGTGKTKRVAVFADGEKALEAKEAGADLVGGTELIAEIKQSGRADFDIAIATPDMMRNLAGVAKVLGPRGLMPSPKNDTVTLNIKAALDAVKGGKINFKNDDSGIVHQVIGRRSFTLDNLYENYAAFIESVRKARPAPVKGTYIKAVTIATTMGPGIRIAV
ncbi:50S ribosomal protein L1 [Candidatus Uhrbacteria bacterium]|nr:50S ribosomal protein L1 [Candidatus Uhrbacteria bacterium]